MRPLLPSAAQIYLHFERKKDTMEEWFTPRACSQACLPAS
jgi:hypothetical protein